MQNPHARLLHAAFMTLAGTIASALVGLIFFGTQVFAYRSPAAQFIMLGALISLLISVARSYDVKTLLGSSLVVVGVLPFLTNAVQKVLVDNIIRDLLFGLSIVASVFLARWLKNSRQIRDKAINEMVLWVLAVVTAYLAAGTLLAMRYPEGRTVAYFALQLRFGFLIGMGVSVGTVGYSLLSARRNQSTAG